MEFFKNVSESFKIRNSFKQVSVLAPTLFGIFFLLFPKQAFGTVKKSTYLNTRNNGKLFNPSRLKAKKKGKRHDDKRADVYMLRIYNKLQAVYQQRNI